MHRLAGWALLAGTVSAQPFLIEHATVIDTAGGPAKKNIAVLVDQGRITALGPKIQTPPGATVVNAKGKFLIPGLWDMHVHITDPDQFFPRFLAAGVTGVREMYSGIAANVSAQWRTHPLAPLMALPGFVDGPLLAAGGPPPPGAFAVANAEQARTALQLHIQAGVDFLKVYNSLPRDAYLALADAARLIGIPFTGHVPEEVSPREAALVGQRTQEHLINVLLACSSQEEELRRERLAIMSSPALSPPRRARLLGFPPLDLLTQTYDPEKAQELFSVFAASGTWQTPTLALLKGFSQNVTAEQRKRMPLAWNPSPHALVQDLNPELAEHFQSSVRSLLVRHLALVREMHMAGVKFLAGTDTSISNPVPIGFGLHEELALLVEAGFTPLEALQTATRNPAEYFARLDQMGAIEVGKMADLVLLDADPLRDIRNVGKIRGVMLRGKYYDRNVLDKLLPSK